MGAHAEFARPGPRPPLVEAEPLGQSARSAHAPDLIYFGASERAMSPRKQIVERYAECFSHQDWSGLGACLTEDAERLEAGQATPVRGRAEIERDMRPGPNVLGLRMKVARMIEEGDVVVAEGTVQISLSDGKPLEVVFSNHFEFQGDKIRRVTSYSAVQA